jgi:hypothetical protein
MIFDGACRMSLHSHLDKIDAVMADLQRALRDVVNNRGDQQKLLALKLWETQNKLIEQLWHELCSSDLQCQERVL